MKSKGGYSVQWLKWHALELDHYFMISAKCHRWIASLDRTFTRHTYK